MYIRRYYDKEAGRDLYRFRVQIGGVDYRDKGFADRDQARTAVHHLRSRLKRERYDIPSEDDSGAVTLAQLVEARRKELDTPDLNDRRARAVLIRFAARLPAKRVADLTESDLRDYVRDLKAEFSLREEMKRKKRPGYEPRPISPETVNKHLGIISSMLADAPKTLRRLAGYRRPDIPWEKVSRRKRKRPLTEEEDELLLAGLREPRRFRECAAHVEARGEVADLFEINLNTGMRGGETVKLTWTQVNFAAGEIYLGKTKNGEDRFVPMNSRVAEILRRRFLAKRSPYVFPSPDGKRPRYNYRKTFRLVAERLGLPYGQRLDYGFTMHSTRHTATTRMLRAGADISTVQEVVGHSDQTMTLVYAHASAETKKRAVESLVRRKPGKSRRGSGER